MGKAGSIWVAWVRRKYLSRSTFWALNVNSQSISWSFRKILKLRPTAARFLRIKVGNGDDTFFWWDPWTPFGPLLDFLGKDAPAKLGIPLSSLVKDVMLNGGWNLPPARSEAFLQVLCYIISIEPSQIWNAIRASKPPVPWAPIIWHKKQQL
ncbi:unnamed protein product [Thlaspi arvense]|uniref:Reverse transcriptase zinc-binding domain-containing protein n=1 Tax=Thlaspi arvense TaxID=13288 RepID=A0AAU9SAR7_THLAR|nr:unnamed protein product [Thlaspi arvense]